MLTDNYAVFRKFNDVFQAKELESKLLENGIDCTLRDNSPALDITFSGNTLQNEVQLMVRQSQFEKANLLMESESEVALDAIDTDHYLYGFSDEELYDILLKPDEWSTLDYQLSHKILQQRGKNIDPTLISSLKNKRLKELAQPEKDQKLWISIGYVLSLIGGFIGIFIGYYIWRLKKTLPNGQKVYVYNEHNRRHGKYIFIIGLIVFPVSFIVRFLI